MDGYSNPGAYKPSPGYSPGYPPQMAGGRGRSSGRGGRSRRLPGDEEDEPEAVEDTGFSNGKTILVIAIVVGCFAVLWPKIFCPMLFGSLEAADPRLDDTEGENFMHPALGRKIGGGRHPGTGPVMGGAGGGGPPPHHPHPAPVRTVEKEWKDRGGPMPGMRPTIGGPGTQPQQPKGGGSMGVLMPIYTVAIIVFFVYTTMKIMFKNKEEEEDDEPNVSGQNRFYKEPQQGCYPHQDYYRYGSVVTDAASLPPGHYPADTPAASPTGLQHQRTHSEVKKKVEFSEPLVRPHPVPHSTEQAPELTKGRRDHEEPETEVSSGNPRPEPRGTASAKPEAAECRQPTAHHQHVEDLDPRDLEISQLKRRLEETERAMDRIVAQMGAVTSRLAPHLLAMAGGDSHHHHHQHHNSQDGEHRHHHPHHHHNHHHSQTDSQKKGSPTSGISKDIAGPRNRREAAVGGPEEHHDDGGRQEAAGTTAEGNNNAAEDIRRAAAAEAREMEITGNTAAAEIKSRTTSPPTGCTDCSRHEAGEPDSAAVGVNGVVCPASRMTLGPAAAVEAEEAEDEDLCVGCHGGQARRRQRVDDDGGVHPHHHHLVEEEAVVVEKPVEEKKND